MEVTRFERVQRLFEEAIRIAPGRQREFVERETDDETMRAEVLAMLEKDRTGQSVLDLPLAQAARLAWPAEDWLSQPFGPYRTIRLLGEGGMGVVYLAEREDI